MALIAALVPAVAQADITTPQPGETVSGVVEIREGRGGQDGTLCSGANSRIQVDRVVTDGDDVQVFADDHGSGAWSAHWDSVGEPLGEYRIRSWTQDTSRSWFSCSTQGEVLRSDLTVTLDNRAAVDVELPSEVVTGETLPVEVTTSVEATGQDLGDREVTIEIPEVGEETLTTDGDGHGATTVDLPDLPAGALTVTATVAGDDAFAGGEGASTTTLSRRTTETVWRGATRGDPGDTVPLVAQVVDVTPGSDRHGDAVADVPVELYFEGHSETVTTIDSGRAATAHTIDGESRLADAGAIFHGDDMWRSSDVETTFYVGDEAAQEAQEEHSTVGGLTRVVGGLLGGVVETTTDALTTTTDVLSDLLGSTGPVGDRLEDLLEVVDAGLLHLLSDNELIDALDLLLGELGDGVGSAGDPVDDAIDASLDQLAQAGPVGDLEDTVRFDWRAVHVTSDGEREAREFGALIGVPEPLDVTGDGNPDVLANLTFTSEVVSLDVGPGELIGMLDSDAEPLVPRLEIARLPGAPAELPISLQAVVTLPDMDEELRVGYDARESDAPDAFRADILMGDDGIGLQLASKSDVPLTLTGAIVGEDTEDGPLTDEQDPPDAPDFEQPAERPDTRPGEQRFAVSFDPAPRDARIALDLGDGSGQDLGATFTTDRPTEVGVQFVDDAIDEVFFLEGVVDAIDGDLSVGLETGDQGDIGVSLTGDRGLERVALQGTGVADGEVREDLLLAMTDVPEEVSLGLEPDGTADLHASDAIGLLEVGFATGRSIATLDEDAFLHLLSEGVGESVAARLPGVEALSMSTGEDIGLEIDMAATPLRALVREGDLTLDANILDAPESLRLALAADGAIEIEGSEAIDEVTVTASDDTGIFLDATRLDLRIEDVPSLLSVGIEDDGVRFETGGNPVGLLEIQGTSGPEPVLPEEGDGLALTMTEEAFVVAGRISGLRTIGAVLDEAPELELDTVAGNVFTLDIATEDLDVAAEIDHLVPGMHLRMVDEGGAMGLEYAAAEPTNRISFDLDGLEATLADPMPAELEICMADDEACLPELGIADPEVGSVRFEASEYTTLNLTDPSGEMSANDLRLRKVDLTGDLDLEDGGSLYLDTTELGEHCPDVGCVHPVESGSLTIAMGDVEIGFTPGGFAASDATIDLEVDMLFGQPVGVTQVGQTGHVFCTPDTRLEATASVPVIGSVTLDLTDGICDSSEPLPEPGEDPEDPEGDPEGSSSQEPEGDGSEAEGPDDGGGDGGGTDTGVSEDVESTGDESDEGASDEDPDGDGDSGDTDDAQAGDDGDTDAQAGDGVDGPDEGEEPTD